MLQINSHLKDTCGRVEVNNHVKGMWHMLRTMAAVKLSRAVRHPSDSLCLVLNQLLSLCIQNPVMLAKVSQCHI